MSERRKVCSSCGSFEPIDDLSGSCRRHAPRAIVDRGATPHTEDAENYALWPTVTNSEWCCEWTIIVEEPG